MRLTKAAYRKLILDELAAGKLPACGPDSDGNPNAISMYRTPDGRGCVAGLAMSDAAYKPEFEGKGCMAIGLEAFDLLPVELRLWDLARLQAVHDQSSKTHTQWDRDQFVDMVNAVLGS
jgi:hypothetical protein